MPQEMADYEEVRRAGADLLTELRLDVRYIKEALRDIRAKLDTTAAKEDFADFKNETNARLKCNEEEIENLKNFRYWILGAGAAVGVISNFIFRIIFPGK